MTAADYIKPDSKATATKQQAIESLQKRVVMQQQQLRNIDPRLEEYYLDLCQHSTTEPDDPNDRHNVWELLGALRFLRLLRIYTFSHEQFEDVIFKYEGTWKCEGRIWRHISGGVKHPNDNCGATYYRLQPFQVFVLAAIFGLRCLVNTHNEAGTRDMLPTEQEIAGEIWDCRRLCTEFTLYTPRKTAKTQLSAFIQFWFFMSGDVNAECYCCANASDQAKILFGRTKALIQQMDPREQRIRFTAQTVNWKEGQFRQATLAALSAGGKTKDGTFAQLCSADEYGSAAYVNGKSDMGRLVSVIESSMGPRREPMTFISTTAGTIQAGPFIDKLEHIHNMLLRELELDTLPDADNAQLHDASDRHLCLLLEPDEWERTDDYLLTSRNVRRKVNPMLGIIVQHSFYDDEVSKARTEGPEKLGDVISKDFNMYRGVARERWIAPDRIRSLQVPKRITDCTFANGWNVFCGMDFSFGDDIFAITYLGINYVPTEDMQGRFFVDCDAWILEDTMKRSPNLPLYEKWVEQGWLHVCPGEVFDSSIAVQAIIEKTQAGVNITAFGYDPAQSMQPINELKAWLQTLFQAKQTGDAKDIADTIHRMVVPVSQTALTQTPRVRELERLILAADPWIQFSMNPMWPWQFGNCALEVNDKAKLCRVVKGGPRPTHKMDNVAALIDALYLFDLQEGK